MEGNMIFMNASDIEVMLKKVLLTIFSEQQKVDALDDTSSVWLTRLNAAKYLHMSLPTLSRYTKEGLIMSHRVKNKILYKKQDLDNALDQRIFR